jgi:hypothetical protein
MRRLDVNADAGKCPHCGAPIPLRPIAIEQETNCQACGRLVVVPAARPASAAALPGATVMGGGAASELEVILALTMVCVFSNMVDVWVVNVLFLVVVVVVLSALYAQGRSGDVARGRFGERLSLTVERLQIYPYELFVVPGWLGVIALRMADSRYREPFSAVLLVVSLVLTVYARRALRQPAMIREQVRPHGAGEFVLALLVPGYRQRLRTRNAQRLVAAEKTLITRSADARPDVAPTGAATPDQPPAQDGQAVLRDEADARYTAWIREESGRFRNDPRKDGQ